MSNQNEKQPDENTDTKTNSNEVYYGEYSLKHWIDLILSENIVLPEYQRTYCWKEDDITSLIDAFDKKLFIPPVIIGSQRENEKNKNVILDGQQRLTSILLATLGLYPKFEKYKNENSDIYDNNDNSENNDTNNIGNNKILKWTFSEIIKQTGDNTISKIKEKINREHNDKYNKLELGKDIRIDDNFLNNTYLGFCYLVPDNKKNDEDLQRQYYAEVFRSINIGGIELTAQESREALYYLDKKLIPYFKPKFIEKYTINTKKGKQYIDFIRYISFLTQYQYEYEKQQKENSKQEKENSKQEKENIFDKLAENTTTNVTSSIEKYYKEYIYFIVTKGKKYNDTFGIYKPINNIENFNTLENNTKKILGEEYDFKSIIDADIYFFGLIYISIFLNKELKNYEKHFDISTFIEELNNRCLTIKNNPNNKDSKEKMAYEKSPNTKYRLRKRIKESINIYIDLINGKYKTNNEGKNDE